MSVPRVGGGGGGGVQHNPARRQIGTATKKERMALDGSPGVGVLLVIRFGDLQLCF